MVERSRVGGVKRESEGQAKGGGAELDEEGEGEELRCVRGTGEDDTVGKVKECCLHYERGRNGKGQGKGAL